MSISWYSRESKIIPSQGIPLSILDLCQQYDHNCHRALRGTQLFLEDILEKNPNINQEQLLRLVDNANQLLVGNDTAFLLGQRLLPGNYGAVSQVLTVAPNLYSAIEILTRMYPIVSPLLRPKFYLDERYGYLYWMDDCGLGKLEQTLIETIFSAIIAYSRRQNGQHLPWHLSFKHNKPTFVEQYWVHLGEQLSFAQPRNLMRIPREYLFHQWQVTSISSQLALQQAELQLQQLPAKHSLLTAVNTLLTHALTSQGGKRMLQLESVAQTLELSPATLKRYLKKHGTQFQQQLDQARLHQALYLIKHQGLSTEAVAAQLGFHDSAGFRRSFKRWTGTTPSHICRFTV